MKIVHICPQYTDGMSYQENYLCKYHHKFGNEVTVITSNYTYQNGELKIDDKSNYKDLNGIKVIRLTLTTSSYQNKFKKLNKLKEVLLNEQPDILFIHGFQFCYIKDIVDYIKINPVKVYVDNHADYSNSATNWISKRILHGIIWKYYAQMIEPYTTRFYGVLPARVEILMKLYKLPANKCKLLLMGGDDDLIEENKNMRQSIRHKYGINDTDFLLMTGGKIDKSKIQVLNLMKAIKCFPENVKLLIFGSIDKELDNDFKSLMNSRIIYLGWIESNESYKVMTASDLMVFPGRHSVLWEQSCSMGIPLVAKYWKGTNHIDTGGNVEFLYNDNLKEVIDVLNKIILNKEKYLTMKEKAENNMKKFFYSEIAKESLL